MSEQTTGTTATTPPVGEWAIVELMGHVRLGGFVTEEEHFGAKVGRIDIPLIGGGMATQLFGGGSLYRLTYVTEEFARGVALHNQPEPVHRWELPRVAQTNAPSAVYGDPESIEWTEHDLDDLPL